MRLATWNVNSLRSRIDRVEAFLQRHDIDVLALQETKAREDQLPLMGLQALGYEVAVAGVNQWNGVAIVSRVGLEDVQVGFAGMPGWGEPLAAESRAIGAACGGVRVWSLYVPNGRKPDDPHYVYKLDWLARLREAAPRVAREDTALVGDWNVAPATRTSSTWRSSRSRRTCRRRSGRRSRVPRRRVGRRGGAHTPARRSTPTGTTTGSASSGTVGCGSTSSSARPRWPGA